jgi:hypothetical protein
MTDCNFIGNHCEYVGGAIYLLDRQPLQATQAFERVIAALYFVENRTERDGRGDAVFVDGQSRVNLTDARLAATHLFPNSAHPDRWRAGQSLFDANRYPSLTGAQLSRFAFNETSSICKPGFSPSEVRQPDKSVSELLSPSLAVRPRPGEARALTGATRAIGFREAGRVRALPQVQDLMQY